MVRPPAPKGELSYIPLPVVLSPNLPAKISPLDAEWSEAYYGQGHHAFFPANTLKQQGLGGLALRHCRMQRLTPYDHRGRYHALYDGPDLPQTELEQYETVVLAVAGYIPEKAIKFDWRNRAVKLRLTPDDRTKMMQSGHIYVAYPQAVRDFLLDFTLRNGIDAIPVQEVDEFLYTTDLARRIQIGRVLLQAASEAFVKPLDSKFDFAKRLRLLPATAESASSVVCDTLLQWPDGTVNKGTLRQIRMRLTDMFNVA